MPAFMYSTTRPPIADDPSGVVVPLRAGPIHWTLIAVALLLGAWLYLWLAGVLIATTNQDPLAQDQKNNMRQALRARPTLTLDLSDGVGPALSRWLPHQSDGVVAPLWPWVAAHFARDGHTIDEATFQTHSIADLAFFDRGKWFNVGLCGLFLAITGVCLARRWTVLAVVNFLLLGGLGALLPRAVTFQPEPLYFILFFLCWVMALRLCARNALGSYVLFGALCGLAYLTKSSIQPLMGVWFGATAVRLLLSLRWPTERWGATRHVVGVAMWAATFLVIIAPRLCAAQERWGRSFFAYPNVWMWMDDFNTGFEWMRTHPDKASLDAVPRNEWPSFSTYCGSHPPEQMWGRLRGGVTEKVSTFFAPKPTGRGHGAARDPWKRILERRGAYLAGLAGIAGLASSLWWRQRRVVPSAPGAGTPGGPATVCGALFVVGVFVASALLYGWYTPIGRGDRFMLSLYLPLVFSLLAWAEAMVRPLGWGRGRWIYAAAHAVLMGFILWRVSEIIRYPVFHVDLR